MYCHLAILYSCIWSNYDFKPKNKALTKLYSAWCWCNWLSACPVNHCLFIHHLLAILYLWPDRLVCTRTSYLHVHSIISGVHWIKSILVNVCVFLFSRFMICCDHCEEWFHGMCVGITMAQGRQMEKNGQEYVCPKCQGEECLKGMILFWLPLIILWWYWIPDGYSVM